MKCIVRITESLTKKFNCIINSEKRELSQRQKITQCRQSRVHPAWPNVLSPKFTSILGTWNVRIMYQSGKSTIIANEMKRYKLSILGLSETRWTSWGETELADDTTIIYSRHPDDGAPHTEDVSFMLTLKAYRALISWDFHRLEANNNS